jgi:pentose-5-phosphate-3-epimerase
MIQSNDLFVPSISMWIYCVSTFPRTAAAPLNAHMMIRVRTRVMISFASLEHYASIYFRSIGFIGYGTVGDAPQFSTFL